MIISLECNILEIIAEGNIYSLQIVLNLWRLLLLREISTWLPKTSLCKLLISRYNATCCFVVKPSLDFHQIHHTQKMLLCPNKMHSHA